MDLKRHGGLLRLFAANFRQRALRRTDAPVGRRNARNAEKFSEDMTRPKAGSILKRHPRPKFSRKCLSAIATLAFPEDSHLESAAMSSALKTFLLALLIAILPLQGFAAIAMPACHQGQAVSAGDADVPSHHGGHDHSHEAPAPDHGQPHPAGHFGYDHCGTAAAFAIPVIATTLPAVSVAERSLFFAAFVSGHIPEQPQRPPRAVLI